VPKGSPGGGQFGLGPGLDAQAVIFAAVTVIAVAVLLLA
jgi:hypothetical protein